MSFPRFRSEMVEQGYIADNEARCRGCQAEIEWWITPNGSKLCMDPMPEASSHARAHWATCPKRSDFRKPKPAQAPKPEPPQSTLF